MSRLNENPAEYSPRLQANLQEIPFAIYEHVLGDNRILRPKQRETIDGVAHAAFDGNRAVAMVMPTGTGKTVMTSQIVAGLPGKKTLIVTDSRVGVLQTEAKLQQFAGISPGLYYEDRKDVDNDVIVTTHASWQSPDFPIDPLSIDLLVVDEAHKAISEARLATMQRHENALWIALSASPTYSERRSLQQHFATGYEMSVPDAVHHGLISSFRNIVLNSDIDIDLDQIDVQNTGDYNKKALAKALNTEARNRISAEYLLFGAHPDTGQPIRQIRGINSCTDIQHARDKAEQTNALFETYYPGQQPKGGFMRDVDGKTKDRDKILQHFYKKCRL